jgi:hypothetical protein
MAKEKSLLPVTLSALFATLLSCVLALLVINKFSIWNHLGTGEKIWAVFASAYAVVLTVSGWLYGALESRVAGITHAVLMLGVAGIVLYGVLSGFVSNPGSDNAAAGIVAAANLVFVIIGALAAICGVAVLRRIFPGKEPPEKPQ